MKLKIAAHALCWMLLTSASLATEVQLQSGSLTVHADGVPLSEVLDAIGQQANLNVIFVGANPAAEAAVRDHFTDLPLEKAVTRLLKGRNHLLIRDQGTGDLAQIYMLAGNEAGLAAASARGRGFPEKPKARETLLDADNIEADQDSRPVIERAQNAQNTEDQIRALHELANIDESRTGEVVRKALQSPEPEVRLAALSTMYQALPVNQADRMELRRLATEDASHAVRAEALEMFLQEATADEVNTLRSEMEGDGFTGIFAMQQLI